MSERTIMALDSLQTPPIYVAPKAARPEVIVDTQRVILVDPTDLSMPGRDGPMGASGGLGRLVYAARTPSSRGF